METLKNVLLVCHVIVCIILTVIVLMQSGKAEGLSGSIAGGAETFFGKNKGRTMDAILEKFTVVFAVLFLALSIALTVTSNKISANKAKQLQDQLLAQQQQTQQTEGSSTESGAENSEAIPAEGENGDAAAPAQDAQATEAPAEANAQ